VRENKIYRQALCLVEIFYLPLTLVPVLTSNNKQHILSPANVIKVRYSLVELYVKSVYLTLFGWRGGRNVHETFEGRLKILKFGKLCSRRSAGKKKSCSSFSSPYSRDLNIGSCIFTETFEISRRPENLFPKTKLNLMIRVFWD
jgi:hypothetical protein